MEANFLTPGRKLKKLRTELEMSQQDLEDKNITRAYISMLENEKRSITKEVAIVLVKKLKYKAHILDINLDIDEDYLTSTPCMSAEKYCNKKLESYTSEDELSELLHIAENYNLYAVKGKIYNITADIKYKENDYKSAFLNYGIAVDMFYKTNKQSKIAYLTNRIGLCMLNQNLISEAIYYFDKARCISMENNDIEVQKNAMYNLALCYNRLDMLDKCNMYTNNLIKLDDGLDLKILKALILEKQNKIDAAINLFEKILNQRRYINDPLISIVYNNLGDLYLKNNNYSKSLENFNKSQKIRESNNDLNLSHTLIEKALVYKNLNKINNTMECILKARELAMKNNDIEYVIRAYDIQSTIYEENNDNESLLKIQLELFKILDKTEKTLDKIKVCNKIIDLYSQKNDLKKIREFAKISFDMIQNTKNKNANYI